MVLDKIQRPNDVKELKEQELPILADEIRQFIIDKVSDNDCNWHIIYNSRWDCN